MTVFAATSCVYWRGNDGVLASERSCFSRPRRSWLERRGVETRGSGRSGCTGVCEEAAKRGHGHDCIKGWCWEEAEQLQQKQGSLTHQLRIWSDSPLSSPTLTLTQTTRPMFVYCVISRPGEVHLHDLNRCWSLVLWNQFVYRCTYIFWSTGYRV